MSLRLHDAYVHLYHFPINTAQKIKFSIKDFFSKPADLVTFTGHIIWSRIEEILNGKFHFLCSIIC